MDVSGKGLRLVVISGFSGSGKSCAIKCFEDLGFFCVDNLPPQLLPPFVSLCRKSGNVISKAAIGIDIRERSFLENFLKVFDRFVEKGYVIELLFLQARDEILQRRFSESRRPHPLAKEDTVLDGIHREKKILENLRSRADRVIDTSDYPVHRLKEVIAHYYLEKRTDRRLNLSFTSFGYKYGTPYDLDLLFDVRFIENPFFVEALRPLTGNDLPVKNFIINLPETKAFLEKLFSFLDFLLPLYEKEGKSYLNVGVGCTGGKHRSVAIVNQLKDYFHEKGVAIHCRHRDIVLDA